MTPRTFLPGNVRRLVLSAALLLGGAVAAHAAEMPSTVHLTSGSAQTSELRLALQKLGFTEVQPVERRGDIFLVKAMWEGRWADLSIDADSGGIRHANAAAPAIGSTADMSDEQLRERLGRLGYTGVGAIERQGNVVTATALQAGTPVTVKIDAVTGAIRPAAGNLATIQKPRDSMTSAELQDALRPLGYTEVRYVEEKGNFYVLDALKDSRWVQLRIDARNGAVTIQP